MSRLLKQLGLTCQRPIFKAWQQNSQQVNNWLKKVFPKIKSRAQLEKADIYFADEAGVRSDYHSGTTWAPKGETPVVSATGARFSVNMISTTLRTSLKKQKNSLLIRMENWNYFICRHTRRS